MLYQCCGTGSATKKIAILTILIALNEILDYNDSFFKSQIVKKSRQLQKQNKYFKSFNTIYALKCICFEKLSSLKNKM